MNRKTVSHVWIIEIKDGSKWIPTIGCGLTRDDAHQLKRGKWEYLNPSDKFRVKKYINKND